MLAGRLSKLEWSLVALAAALSIAAISVGVTTSNAAVAGALAVLAPVTVIAYQSVQTRRAVDTSGQLVLEAQRDRELAVEPFIQPGETTRTRADERGKWVSLRNSGHGPAIQLRVFYRVQGTIHWNHDALLLGAGESRPSSALQELLLLDSQRGASGVSDSIVSEPPDELIAYCLDRLGNWLRFNLSTGKRPDVWRPGEPPPEWVGFLEYR